VYNAPPPPPQCFLILGQRRLKQIRISFNRIFFSKKWKWIFAPKFSILFTNTHWFHNKVHKHFFTPTLGNYQQSKDSVSNLFFKTNLEIILDLKLQSLKCKTRKNKLLQSYTLCLDSQSVICYPIFVLWIGFVDLCNYGSILMKFQKSFFCVRDYIILLDWYNIDKR